MRGKEQEPGDEVAAGDIAAVAKLARHRRPATCSPSAAPTSRSSRSRRPEPAARGRDPRQDEGRRGQARQRAAPARRTRTRCCASSATPRPTRRCSRAWARPTCRSRLERLARKFGVEVETEEVQVPYRETISGTAEAEGKLKKQSGGHGQFAVAWLRVEPNERGAGLRVRRHDRRRRDPPPVHPRGREGRPRDRRARRRARLPRRRREGHVLRRQAPPGRQLGDGVQDRGVARVQGGAGQGRPDPARAGERARRRRCPRRTRATSWATSTASAAASRARRRVGGGEVEIVATVPTSEILRYAIDLRSMTGGRGRFIASRTRTTTRCPPPRRQGRRCAQGPPA